MKAKMLFKLTVLFSVYIWGGAACLAQENIFIKNGQKVAFLGDVVTTGSATGYAQQVMRGLEANGVKAEMILCGNAGTSEQLLAHLDEYVIVKKPDWMILNCGVSDAWAQHSLDQYQQAIAQIVEKTQVAGIKVVIATATMADEDPANQFNQRIAAYNGFLRQLAKDKKCQLADFDMPAAVVSAGGGAHSKRGKVLLVSDYVYLNPLGNQLLGVVILKTLGLSSEQIQKARDSWLDRPDICEAKVGLTLRQYERLDALAAKQNRATSELLAEMVAKALAAESHQAQTP